jgi:hypothetical protein
MKRALPLVGAILLDAAGELFPTPPVPTAAPPPIRSALVERPGWSVTRRGALSPDAKILLAALQGPPVDHAVDLGPDCFPPGSAEITPQTAARLDLVAALTPPDESVQIKVWVKRTLIRHQREANLQHLADKRLEAIRTELERRGIPIAHAEARVLPNGQSGPAAPRGAVVIIPLRDPPPAR